MDRCCACSDDKKVPLKVHKRQKTVQECVEHPTVPIDKEETEMEGIWMSLHCVFKVTTGIS